MTSSDNIHEPPAKLSVQNAGRDLFAGMIAAIVTIAYSVSFSVLIFSGPLHGGVAFGLSALLTGAAVTGLVVGLFTMLVPADAGPDTPAVAVMSVLAVAITAQFSGSDATDAAIAHTLLAITLATFLTGLLLFALGAFRAGIWLRFIPYPVVGGFLAASGWLLITGGIEVILGTPLGWNSVVGLPASEKLGQLAVGLAFAAAILLSRIKIQSFLLLPVAFFSAVVLLDTALLALLDGRQIAGWYLEGTDAGELWMPLPAFLSPDIRWEVFLANSVEIIAVCGVTAIALLLDVSSLELAHGKSSDLDHELRVNGWANMLAAPLGGVAGNLSMVGSLLITEAGAATRLATLTAASICGAAIFFSQWILSVIPTPLLGGVLIYLGVTIFYRALVASAGQRSKSDNFLAAGITLAIVSFGYLIGIVLGILGACLSFAFSYSRINIIRRHLSRANFRSNVDRSPEQMDLLLQNGETIQILWLRGYIFFGTSNSLFEYVRNRILGGDGKPGYILLDFAQVPGFDSSAVFSLTKLKNICLEHNALLAVSGVTREMRGFLKAAGFLGDDGASPVMVFRHRDEALQWCEAELLADLGASQVSDSEFKSWLSRQLGGDIAVERVLSYMKRISVKPGKTLVSQGSLSNSIDLIASGRVVVSLADDSGNQVSLRHMSGQTVVGEMGFYRRAKRTASVIAEQDTVAYRMERKNFDALGREDPDAAATFHSFIIRLLSDRLEFANREIAALQEPPETTG